MGMRAALDARAARWLQHPLVADHGMRVGLLPAGECLVAELPRFGTLSHLVCCARAYPAIAALARQGTCTKARRERVGAGLLLLHFAGCPAAAAAGSWCWDAFMQPP